MFLNSNLEIFFFVTSKTSKILFGNSKFVSIVLLIILLKKIFHKEFELSVSFTSNKILCF